MWPFSMPYGIALDDTFGTLLHELIHSYVVTRYHFPRTKKLV